MKIRNSVSNSRGLSLIELMVAITILSIVSVGIMTFLDNGISAQNAVSFKGQADQLTNEIRTALGSTSACKLTFSASPSIDMTSPTSFFRNQIYDKWGNVVYGTSSAGAAPFGDRTLVISSMSFGNYSAVGTEAQGTLTLLFTATQRTMGPSTLKRTIPIVMNKLGTTLDNCYSKAAGSDSLWMAIGTTSVTAIYFANGYVGVGTPNPAAKLHIVDQNNLGFAYYQYNDGDGANLRNYRARGSIGSPSPILAGDRLADILASGYHSGGTFGGLMAGVNIMAAENFTAAAQGTYLTFVNSAAGTAVGQVERMRIDSSGRVGIGVTSPINRLDVGGSIGLPNNSGATTNRLYLAGSDTNHYIYSTGSGGDSTFFGEYNSGGTSGWHFIDNQSAAERVTILAAGSVGIGTTAPATLLHVNGGATVNGSVDFRSGGVTNNAWIGVTNSVWGSNYLHIGGYGTSPNRYIGMWANTIALNGGNVGIGMFTPAYPLDVAGVARAGSFLSTSDEREKEEIQTSPGLEMILDLRGVTFRWKRDHRRGMGVIAQEVEKVAPDLVSTDSNGRKSVNYEGLIAPLIESVKDLNAKVEASDRIIAELQAEIADLKGEIKRIRFESKVH